MDDTLTAAELAAHCGLTGSAIYAHIKAGRIAPCGTRRVAYTGRPALLFRRADADRLAAYVRGRRQRQTERDRRHRDSPGRKLDRLTAAERQGIEAPAVLYRLLTEAGVAELERRRAKLGSQPILEAA